MPNTIWASLAAIVLAGCSSSPASQAPTEGRIVVALTIDWEGAQISRDGLDAVDTLRKGLDGAPITHFVSAAYFTKARPDATAVTAIAEAVHPGDELALHLHAWRSLAKASGIEPRLSPSFLTGTDELLEFEDGDVGFDLDLDAYSVPELRALVRTSRRLLAQTGVPISKTFRAGGYLSTPKVLQAIRDEGYTVDSGAIDYRQLGALGDDFLPTRIKELWPKVGTDSQPFFVDAPGGPLLELPIAAVSDYVTAPDIVGIFEAAHAQLQKAPGRDVFVVLGFHLETAAEFAGRLGEAMGKVRARHELATRLQFTTMEGAAELARSALTPPPN
ncbi:MAG: hypothetical protein H0T79_14705 [Deltaproteobacteria bacterium]|nr:hypothetical protein [Deltaproteobacteria bacterium]